MAQGLAIVCGVLMCWGAAPPARAQSQASEEVAVRVRFADSVVRNAVQRAVLGAAHRLQRPDCARVFSDFADRNGRPLLATLQASSMTAPRYLTAALWFVDGSEAPQCRTDSVTVAFTSVGSRVIQICGPRFTGRFERQSAAGEVLIIHELLHALGLEEDPASSVRITREVTRRCGGS
jgi:hypothetical protein